MSGCSLTTSQIRNQCAHIFRHLRLEHKIICSLNKQNRLLYHFFYQEALGLPPNWYNPGGTNALWHMLVMQLELVNGQPNRRTSRVNPMLAVLFDVVIEDLHHLSARNHL